MADDLGRQIADRPDAEPYDDSLLSPAGKAAHRERARLLQGNRHARLDLEARWAPVLKGSEGDLVDPGRAAT